MKKKLFTALAISLVLSVNSFPAAAAQAVQPAAAADAAADTKETTVNTIMVLGDYDLQRLKLDLVETSPNRFELLATTPAPGQIHWAFYDSEYFRIEIADESGKRFASVAVNGNESASKAAQYLNRYQIKTGDTIYVYHQESYGRLRILGTVTDAPRDLSTGMGSPTYGTNIGFKVLDKNLKYVAD